MFARKLRIILQWEGIMEIGAGQSGLNGAGFTLEVMEATGETLIFRLEETNEFSINAPYENNL